MSEYDNVRPLKLNLKGDKKKGKKRKHKSKKHSEERIEVDKDLLEHGGWSKAGKVEDITGAVAIEFGKHCYIKALDNGLFTIGAPHKDTQGPAPEEILTAVLINERKVAFKSGYGKYLSVNKNGIVTGRSDAIGAMEQWEPVFQDGKLAIQANNEAFLSVDDEEDSVVAISKIARENNFCTIRCQNVKQDLNVKEVPVEEQGSISQIEVNYVKKFQKFQNKKLKINSGDTKELEQAKDEGTFHEKLLDRRSKMKADRYCK